MTTIINKYYAQKYDKSIFVNFHMMIKEKYFNVI